MRFFINIMFVLYSLNFYAQNKEIDSLWVNFKNAKADTEKVNVLNKISWENLNIGEYDSSMIYAKNALEIAKKNKFKKGIAYAYNNIGNIFSEKGDFQKALENYQISLSIRQEINDKKGIAISYNNYGIVYEAQGNYVEAIKYYFNSLKIKELIKDKKGIAISYNNIGSVFEKQGNYDEAIKYNLASLKIKESLGNKKGISSSYDNIGNIYQLRGNFKEALKNHTISLNIRKEIADKKGISICYKNIGGDYTLEKNYSEALKNYNKSLEISLEIGDKWGVAECYSCLAANYINTNHFKESRVLLNKGLSLSLELGTKKLTKEIYYNLFKLDSATSNFKQALINYKLYIQFKDSLLNEENTKKAIQTNFRYQYEKKLITDSIKNQDEKKIQEAQIIAQNAKIKQQKLKSYGLYGGLFIVIVFALFIYNRFKISQKQNLIIEQQKTEVEGQKELADQRRLEAEEQKHIVENKNKEIIDSINYARRIQNAMLTSDGYLKDSLTNKMHSNSNEAPYFILFKPKDIVSGDFYWFYKTENILYYMTADCTGHGVPGGFMSMLGINLLNEIVIERGVNDPGLILNKLREEIIKSLTTDDGYTRDGMDGVLCKIDYLNQTLEYASANNAFYVLRNEHLIKLKSQKMPIAFSEEIVPFETKSLNLEIGDQIYTFTDGFADQFGGQKGKKFLYKQLEELIIANGPKRLTEQKEIFEKTFETWKGELDQVDDVCIISLKI